MAEGINEIVSTWGSNLVSGSAWVIIGLAVFFGVLGLMYYVFFYRKRFNIFVKINSQRAGDAKTIWDYAAILTKNKKKYFKLLKMGIEIEVPPFKVMQATNKGDYLELWRKSEDEFVFISPARLDKEWVVRADGKSYPMGQTKQRHFESDLEWIARRREETKKILDPETIWMKLLEFAPQIVSSVFLFIILWIFMEKLPPLISQLTELAKTLNGIYGTTTAP